MIKITILLVILSPIYSEEATKPLPYEAQQVVEKLNNDILKVRKDAVAKLNKVMVEVTKSGNLELALL